MNLKKSLSKPETMLRVSIKPEPRGDKRRKPMGRAITVLSGDLDAAVSELFVPMSADEVFAKSRNLAELQREVSR